MTRFEVKITRKRETILHIIKQPHKDAAKAKLARAYPDGDYAVISIQGVSRL